MPRAKSPARRSSRSKSPARAAKVSSKPKIPTGSPRNTTTKTAVKDSDGSSSDLANVALLGLWFCTSIYFNYMTPEFNKYLNEEQKTGTKTDIVMVELLSASSYGVVLLTLAGLPLLPPRALAKPMALVGFCHLWACRLFIMAVCGEGALPVSLAQTIRAANPFFVVVVSFAFAGTRYPPKVLLSLVPLVAGFAMTTLAETDFHLPAFLCAVGSVTILVVMSLISKAAFSDAQDAPHWAQVQLWSCAIASLMLAPTWMDEGGPVRVAAALAHGDLGRPFKQLIALNGAMYYAEQVMQFRAIESYAPLTYGVIDTVRRLCIVVITGYFMRDEVFTTNKSVGVAVVCFGAIYYNRVKDEVGKEAAAAAAKEKQAKKKKVE